MVARLPDAGACKTARLLGSAQALILRKLATAAHSRTWLRFVAQLSTCPLSTPSDLALSSVPGATMSGLMRPSAVGP
jgi:hypothetical protein